MSIGGQKVSIRRRETFSASHYLYNPNLTKEENDDVYSKCTRHHGHNYVVNLSISGQIDASTGMIIEFEFLKKIMQRVINKYDHQHLNDLVEFKDIQTTVENLAQVIWNDFSKLLPSGIKIESIELYETEKNSVLLTNE